MTDQIDAQLQTACDAFADQPGEISILVEGVSHAGTAAVHPDRQVPAASLIKLAIACAAFSDETVDLGQYVALRDMDETRYCSILKAFEPASDLSLKELIGLMLIISDNPATSAVLDIVQPSRVNAWLKSKGMTSSNFSAGFTDRDLDHGNRENLTSAADCLTLLKRVYDPLAPFAEIQTYLANNLRNDRIPKRLPDEAIIMHKTGTLNGLVHDIAIIEHPQVSYYFIVLAKDLPDSHRFTYDLALFSEQIFDLMLTSTPR